jgi:hypothetical protein
MIHIIKYIDAQQPDDFLEGGWARGIEVCLRAAYGKQEASY